MFRTAPMLTVLVLVLMLASSVLVLVLPALDRRSVGARCQRRMRANQALICYLIDAHTSITSTASDHDRYARRRASAAGRASEGLGGGPRESLGGY